MNNRSNSLIIKYWVPLCIYIGIIFYLSSVPDLGFISRLNEMDPRKFSLHALEYSGLGFLLYLAIFNSGLSRRKAIVVTIALSLALAFLDEKYQLGIPGRRFNPYDIYSDVFGATAGALIAALRGRSKD